MNTNQSFIKYSISSIAIAFILFLSACSGEAKKEEEAAAHEEEEGIVEFSEVQYKTAKVELGGIQKRSLTGLLKVNGLLDVPPQNKVSISVPFGGILKDTDLLQGMWINKGQTIARMEHPDYIDMQQAYIEASSQLSYMEKEYQRQQELNRENVSAVKTFEKTEADFRSMKSKVESLKQKLLLLNVSAEEIAKNGILKSIPLISPISGYVTEVNANIGKFVQANEVIFEIVDTRHLHAELLVFEKDVPKLKEGQKVRFVLANETKERVADIHLIGREIGPDRTVQVHCHLSNEDKNLLPGMFLKATVETGLNETDALPSEAVVDSDGKKFIFIQVESKEEPGKDDGEKHYSFQRVEVATGVIDGDFTEVMLPDSVDRKSNRIVVNGAYDLLSKMNNSSDEEHH